ncbi:SH3 domain-containing protein [Celeribacter ethanolicus]|uniref:SH3 domain-containing protein n=1 Tax=Celeribacter ethanolicus TaxID=1758178 RepID=UPI00082FEF35|nr:SH3 domain-containing protein [Celeribacter ethanolicus]
MVNSGRFLAGRALIRVALLCLLVLSPVAGQADSPTRGPVTNLPLPRFVSLKSDKANARRGPSLSHRIDWVFVHRGYPLEVIAEYGHWRRVRDIEGATGWLHYSLISGVRTALVTEDSIDLFSRPDPTSRLAAQAEKNVILRLLECDVSWCKVSADGQKGWALKSGLWGVRPDEILE